MSLEKIVAVAPDLIIAWGSGTSPSLRKALERLGLPLYIDEIRSLAELQKSLLDLGQLTGRGAAAEMAVTPLRRLPQSAETRDDVPGVFMQLWDKPLQSIGASHLLNEVITRCGGRSITDDIAGLAPVVSIEYVLSADPALIVVEDQKQGELWEPYETMHAVANSNIAVIDPDVLHRPTLRLLQGMSVLCARIDAIRRRPPRV
jgi:ABC-type Fe3+-hydroxamate transport system substrate-binding protein